MTEATTAVTGWTCDTSVFLVEPGLYQRWWQWCSLIGLAHAFLKIRAAHFSPPCFYLPSRSDLLFRVLHRGRISLGDSRRVALHPSPESGGALNPAHSRSRAKTLVQRSQSFRVGMFVKSFFPAITRFQPRTCLVSSLHTKPELSGRFTDTY